MKKSICFVSLYSYALFKQGTNYVFGGSEFRARLFGSGLSNLPENDISFVVFNHGQPKTEHINKIKVYSHSYYKGHNMFTVRLFTDMSECIEYIGRDKNFPFFKIKIKKFIFSLLWKIPLYLLLYYLEQARLLTLSLIRQPLRIGRYPIEDKKISVYCNIDADIYCAFGVSNLTAEVSAFCKKYSKKFVLFLGSDLDLSSDYHAGSQMIGTYNNVGYVCHYAIDNADLIITQTIAQARLLKERFEKESVTIANPIDLNNYSHEGHELLLEKYALWIGKSDDIKQPEIILKLAEIFKDVEFVMVLNKFDPARHTAITEKKIDNVKIIEYIPINEVEKLFLNAFVFVSTSAFEGFPNTFLQAGKYEVPVLSLNVDPDNFISNNNCGIVARGSFKRLEEGLRMMIQDPNKRELFSRNIRDYVYKNHELKSCVKKLNDALEGL